MSSPEALSKFNIEYGGNFYQDLDWQFQRFDNFAKVSDLRTTITVTNGGEAARSAQQQQMGNTLIWRKILSPNSLFTRPSTLNGNIARTYCNLDLATGTVEINDKVITEQLREKNEGIIDKEIFAKRVDGAVRQGVLQITAAEKLRRLNLSSFLLFITGGSGTLPGLTGVGLLKNGLEELFSDPSKYADFATIGKIFIGGLCLDLQVICWFKDIRILQIVNGYLGSHPFIQSLSDVYDPFKHIYRFGRANLDIYTASKPFVTLKD